MGIILLVALFVLPFAGFGKGREIRRFAYSQVHMGVRVNLILYAEDESRAEEAAKGAFARFAELDAIMSDYRTDSEISRLASMSGKGKVKVSEDLFRVLEYAQKVSRLSGGAFDVTCGPIVSLWREAQKTKKLPDYNTLQDALSKTGWKKMDLDKHTSTVELKTSGMKLDLGGIAKGYACDEAMFELKKHGIKIALVEAGGDIAVSQPPPGEKGWRIAVRGFHPKLQFLSNCGVSTSGDVYQFVEINGMRYSHIVDPRTGIGLTNRLQVTVIARNAMMSDSLATALCVLGEKEGKKLASVFGAKAIFTKTK